jgi:hypothetical protein
MQQRVFSRWVKSNAAFAFAIPFAAAKGVNRWLTYTQTRDG